MRPSRTALGLAALGIAGLGAFAPTAASRLNDPEYQVDQLRPNAWLVRGAGANVVILEHYDKLTVVDSKLERHGDALRRAIAKITTSPIRYVINTHHHEENCGGNSALRDTQTTVIAHDAAAERLQTLDGNRAADLSFRSRLKLALGKTESATLHHKGAGHTDSDIIAHFARAEILVTGGLVAKSIHPSFAPDDGADLRRWIRVLDELADDFGDEKNLIVVPGDGSAGTIDLLRDQATYLRDILDWMEDAQRHGLDRAEAMRDAERLRVKYAEWRGEGLEGLLDAAYRTAGRR